MLKQNEHMGSNIFKRTLLIIFIGLLHFQYAIGQDYIIRIMSANDKELALIECDNYYDYYNGFAAVKTDSCWTFFDEKGVAHFRNLNLISAENFADNGLAMVQTESGYGFINKTGKFVVQPIYSSAYGYDFSNIALVENDNKWGVLDAQGKLIIPIEFDGIQSLGAAIAVIKESSVAFYTNTGKPITGFDYNGYGSSNYDVVSVRSDAGWSFLDKYGNVSAPQYFDEIGNYAEGRIGFIRYGKLGYVNSKGVEVIPAIYESGDEFSGGLAAVRKDGLWGYIDTAGTVVIPFTYTAAFKFYDGFASVKNGEAWLSINKKNEIVPEPIATNTSPKSTYIKPVTANERITLTYQKYNYKVEKVWLNYDQTSNDGKIYHLTTGQLIGDNIVFKGQNIVSGKFYKDNKSTQLKAEDGIPMGLLSAAITNQFAVDVAHEEAAKSKQVNTNNAQVDYVAMYTTLLEKMKQEEEQFDKYLDLSTEFDLDAATEEERVANKQKKLQPYVDLINEIVQTIDYLIANDPNMHSDLEAELNYHRKDVLQDLKWIE